MHIATQFTTKTDPEVADFIDTMLPALEKDFGKKPVKKAVIMLYDQDPDQVLQWYLDDQLAPWLSSQALKAKKEPEPEPSPREVGTTIQEYITLRYQRYLDYAKYHTSLAKLNDQSGDVLHEVLMSVLLKDEEQLAQLYGKKRPDGNRELDFYILKMIKLNCHSLTSPYRYKIRQPLIDSNASVSSINNNDPEVDVFLSSHAYVDEEDDSTDDPLELVTLRFRVIRNVLDGPEFSENERYVFIWKFFMDNVWKDWTGKESKGSLTKLYKSARAKLIAGIEKLKEEHRLKVIHKVFSEVKYLDLRISEQDFLLLRQIFSSLQNEPATATMPEDSAGTIQKLEKRMFLKLDQMIKDFEIPDKF